MDGATSSGVERNLYDIFASKELFLLLEIEANAAFPSGDKLGIILTVILSGGLLQKGGRGGG